jgi:hypothetical protein
MKQKTVFIIRKNPATRFIKMKILNNCLITNILVLFLLEENIIFRIFLIQITTFTTTILNQNHETGKNLL